jgi:hypothetical protein
MKKLIFWTYDDDAGRVGKTWNNRWSFHHLQGVSTKIKQMIFITFIHHSTCPFIVLLINLQCHFKRWIQSRSSASMVKLRFSWLFMLTLQFKDPMLCIFYDFVWTKQNFELIADSIIVYKEKKDYELMTCKFLQDSRFSWCRFWLG